VSNLHSIKAESELFDQFWKENGCVASMMMSEYNRRIVLVPGKRDGQGGYKDAIVLEAYGLMKASLVNGYLGSGACLPTEDAVKAFKRRFPEQSFMEKIKTGYKELFH